MRDALTWYVVVQVAGLAVWPVVARGLNPLHDRGWAASKAVGVLAVGWVVWLVCMLTPIPFSRLTLAVAWLVLGGAAWWSLVHLEGTSATAAWLRAQRRVLMAWELLFAAAFVLFAVLRAHEPLIAGFEKPMDMAFLSGFMSAAALPTQDTWLSGYGVPYYYFGYFVLACIGKLSGVAPAVAYNLAAATVPAMAAVGLSGLAWNLARAARVQPVWAAVGSVLTTVTALVCGNLSTFFELLVARFSLSPAAGEALGIKHFAEGITPGVWPPPTGLWWFKASRVIPNTQPDGINEFPFFSALLSDLHPHFVSLPFELLVLSVAAAHVISRGATLRSIWTQGLGALTLGGLMVINTWDVAAFWLLYLGLSLFAAYLHGPWRWRWAAACSAAVIGTMLYAPYFVGYSGPPLGLGIVQDRTPPGSLFVLFGWAIVLLAALGLFTRWCTGDRRAWLLTAVGAVVGAVLCAVGQPSLGVLVALLTMLVPWPGVWTRLTPAAVMVVAVGAFAAAMLLGVEVIFLDDVFHSRMNTVFKFHENAWLLSGLAGGVGVALLGHFTRRARWVVCGLACLFVAGGLVYPLSAVATRLGEQPSGGPTLDGLMFLGADERAAVRWLADQNSSGGRSVISEAVGDEYSSASSMSTYSGATTVLGWAGHEVQWRGPLPVLTQRAADLASLYRDAPPETIRVLLDRYDIRFVVVGDQERKSYGDAVSTRFEGMLPIAFRLGTTVIYRAR